MVETEEIRVQFKLVDKLVACKTVLLKSPLKTNIFKELNPAVSLERYSHISPLPPIISWGKLINAVLLHQAASK